MRQIISIGQALLLLIEKNQSDTVLAKLLKRIYLSGVNTLPERQLLLDWVEKEKDGLFKSYEVSCDYDQINRDPVRRYFESLLAYESLLDCDESLSEMDLEKHKEIIYRLTIDDYKHEDKMNIEEKLAGETLSHEWSWFINEIKTAAVFSELSRSKKSKLIYISQIVYLSVKLCHADPHLPLEIYSEGFYLDRHRGRIRKKEPMPGNPNLTIKQQAKSSNYGILSSLMPLPKNDVLLRDSPYNYPKSADRDHFITNALWTITNFKALMHPFITSISGYMLCQLRSFKMLLNKNLLLFKDEASLRAFFRMSFSVMMMNAGGHSLNELISVLQLEKIQEGFRSVPGFNKLNLNFLFYDNNPALFERVLQKTFQYNHTILQRDAVLQEIKLEDSRKLRKTKGDLEEKIIEKEAPIEWPSQLSRPMFLGWLNLFRFEEKEVVSTGSQMAARNFN